MAIEDYFIDLHFVEKVRQPDGTGGFEYVYKIGDVFRGSATKSSTSEQTLAGIRGDVSEQYTITTHINNVLELSDVLMFVNPDKKRIFLRVNSEPSRNPKQSGQAHWKYATASKFNPDLRVVN